MAKVFEHLKLNLKFIGFSKRLAIIMIVGLGISVAMITQNILFLDSFRSNAFNEFAGTQTETYIATEIDHVGTVGLNILGMIRASVSNNLADVGFEEGEGEQVPRQEWITNKKFYLRLYNELYHDYEFHTTYLIGIEEEFFDLIPESFWTEGGAPETGEYCFITNSDTLGETEVDTAGSFEAYVPVDEFDIPENSYSLGIDQAGKIMSFSGIINIDTLDFSTMTLPLELQLIISMILSFGSEVILTSVLSSLSTVHNIPIASGDISVKGRILFDLQKFNVFNLDLDLAKLQVLVNRLQEDIIANVQTYSNNYDLNMNSQVIPLLSGFKRDFRIFQIFLLVFMLPTLGMSIVLTGFASSQVKKQRDLHVQNLHQRGASRQLLFLFMFLELLAYTFFAVLLGVVLGWPYTLVALKSNGFFSFTKAASLPGVNQIIQSAIWISIGIGFGITFLSNIPTIWQRSRKSVEEAMQEQKEKEPIWQRFYIDIFMLIVGIILWIVATNRISGGSTTALEFAFYFAAPAPILIIVGAIMFITRIYPPIINGLSNLLFRIPKIEIPAISARNAVRRRGSTTRTIILMTITFSLTVSTIVVPDSYTEFDQENAYYSLGADIVIDNVDVLRSNVKSTVEAIEGVELSSYVTLFEYDPTESNIVYRVKILGVELENYSKVAFEEEEYTNGRGIADLLQSINSSSDVIGQKEQMSLLGLGDNTTFVLKNWALEGNDVVEKQYPVTFVDFYQYWPVLFNNPPDPTSTELHIGLISDINLTYTIARNEDEVAGKLFVKVQEGADISSVAADIEEATQLEATSIEELLLISEGSLKSTVLFGALNSSFIVSMFISGATLAIMMLINAVEREKELAVMKSMGISTRQLFSFFITEAIIILVFTMLVGVALGLGTSLMIMKILRIGTIYPPHEMVFPVVKIVWTTLAIFGVGFTSTIIPVIINSRKKVGGALRTQ